MRRILFLISLLALAATYAAPLSSSTDFLERGSSVRGLALAGNLIAESSDDALFYNPAGLPSEEGYRFSAGWHSATDAGLHLFTLLFAPPSRGRFDFSSLIAYNSSGILPETEIQNGQVTETGGYFPANDWLLRIGMKWLTRDGLSLGNSLTLLINSIEHRTAYAFALDSGLRMEILPRLSAGCVLRNLGAGASFRNARIPLPARLELGGQYAVLPIPDDPRHQIRLSLKPSFRIIDSAPACAAGIEYAWRENLFLRAGYAWNPNEIQALHCGIGFAHQIRESIHQVDLAFVPEPLFGHRIAVSYLWRPLTSEP